jgi:hypothetical protein
MLNSIAGPRSAAAMVMLAPDAPAFSLFAYLIALSMRLATAWANEARLAAHRQRTKIVDAHGQAVLLRQRLVEFDASRTTSSR